MENLAHVDTRLVLAAVAYIAWLVRLEAKVLYLEKEVKDHKESSKEKEKAMWDKIDKVQENTSNVLQAVTRIEETLKHIKKDQ